MAASMAWVSKGLRFFSPDRSRRLLLGSMRFSTAASGTSLTRTQIFKSWLLLRYGGNCCWLGVRGSMPNRPLRGHPTPLTDQSIVRAGETVGAARPLHPLGAPGHLLAVAAHDLLARPA